MPRLNQRLRKFVYLLRGEIQRKITEDIVMFSGYMRSAPKNNAELALYVSPSQHELPKNGINISETNYEIELERRSGKLP